MEAEMAEKQKQQSQKPIDDKIMTQEQPISKDQQSSNQEEQKEESENLQNEIVEPDNMNQQEDPSQNLEMELENNPRRETDEYLASLLKGSTPQPNYTPSSVDIDQNTPKDTHKDHTEIHQNEEPKKLTHKIPNITAISKNNHRDKDRHERRSSREKDRHRTKDRKRSQEKSKRHKEDKKHSKKDSRSKKHNKKRSYSSDSNSDSSSQSDKHKNLKSRKR